METTELKVEGMTCGGCVASVKRVLEALPGRAAAKRDARASACARRLRSVEGEGRSVHDAVRSAGYDVAD